jgi:fibro-slime domain-containing protein
VDGVANDLVTPLPDAPQTGQPDSSQGTGKDGVTAAGGADAGNPDGSSDCGNGMLDPGEQCDDRSNQGGDGCSSTCQIEPGWSCTGSPSVCARTVCGNGILEAGEVCDCGTDPTKLPTGCTGPNGLFNGDGTGCSKTCTKEPICRGTNGTGATHACTPTCGNGNLESGEGCDDGNLVNGDGCSSTCQIEPGFTCATQTNSDTQPCTQTMYSGQCLDLPVKLRDFKSEHETGGHPDFFYVGATLPSASVTSINGVQGQANPLTFNRRYCTSASNGPARKNDSTARCWSMAQPSLDANGRPVFDITRNGGGSNATLCDCQFTDWSSDTNGGHVPGYTMANSPLNALTFVSGTSGHPLYKGPAPLATSATTFGQWWIDSSYTNNTHTVATLELGPIAGAANLYRYTSAQDSVYGGFFPLDPPANSFPEYTLIGSTAGPGAVLTSTTGNGEPLLCDLWPYWYSSASYGVGASCKGDQYLTAPSFAPGSDPAAWFGQNPAGAWVPQAQGWYHDFWFTVEARYLFTFNGPFQLQFSGSNEIFVFINGVLVVDLGALHNVIPGRVSIDASGNANIQEGGNFYMPCTNPAGKTTCPVIPAGYSVGDMVPCDGGANAVDPVTGVAFNSTCPSGNSTCDCRQRTLTAAALGLQAGNTYEIAIFSANRAPTDSEMQITINGYTTTRSICQHAVSCSNGSHNGGDGNCVAAGTCSAGYHDGGAGTCVASGGCLTGYHNGGTGTCVASGVCSTGYHDGGTGTCIASGTCSTGYHDGGAGTCVATGVCSTGYHDGGAGICMASGTCSTGYHDGGAGICMASGTCSTGYHDGGTGTCVASGTCSTGYHSGGTGTCVASGTCSLGYHDGGTGTCMVTGTCSAGYHDGGGGACVASGTCSAGYNNCSGTCSSSSCGGGIGSCTPCPEGYCCH